MSPDVKSRPVVSCPSCGADNRLGTPFCTKCGDRIYRGRSAPPKVKKEVRGGVKKAVRNAVVALAAVFVFATLSLMFWPFPSLVQARVDASGSTVPAYLDQVGRALEEGIPPPAITIREGQWNAFARDAHPGEDRKMNVYMTSRKLVLVADEKTGPFQISTRLVMEEDGKSGEVDVRSLWVGHLPLPRFLATPWTRALARRFRLNLDSRLWDALVILHIESNAVEVGAEAEHGR
jgi:hypothetical protein